MDSCETELGSTFYVDSEWELLGLANEPEQKITNPLEKLLFFIWQYKLLKPGDLRTVNGNLVKIIQPGDLNTDSGPDFFNAKLEVDGVTLAGNVEIHTRSSDWLRHGHQNDTSYNNLILHVVYKYDASIEQNKAFNVEVLELKNYIEEGVIEKYKSLITSKASIACSTQIPNIDSIKLQNWLQRMLIERLEVKTDYVRQLFNVSQNDYVQTFYVLLARNFGFKVNAEPFELLAKNLPLHILLKHKSNLFQLEALLFGAAGFLNQQFKDKYPQKLQNEFEFLKNKYGIIPMNIKLWKFMRLRPANFPTLRISQFALIIHHTSDLFLNPIAFADPKELSKAVSHDHQGYWQTHYRLDGPEVPIINGIGESSIQNISINTISAYLFFFGKQNGNDNYIDAAVNAYDNLPFEENSKTKLFTETGLKFKTSGESQGLINLYDNYCKHKACLNCAVASSLLMGKANHGGIEFTEKHGGYRKEQTVKRLTTEARSSRRNTEDT